MGEIKIPLVDFLYERGSETLYINLVDNGYRVIECPYDWRLAIDGEREREMMATVEACVLKAQNGNPFQKVDLLAHSTGGLAARQYVLPILPAQLKYTPS